MVHQSTFLAIFLVFYWTRLWKNGSKTWTGPPLKTLLTKFSISFYIFFTLPFSEISMVGLAVDLVD